MTPTTSWALFATSVGVTPQRRTLIARWAAKPSADVLAGIVGGLLHANRMGTTAHAAALFEGDSRRIATATYKLEEIAQ